MKRRIFLGALAMASATAPLFAQQEKFPVEIKISGKPYQAVLFDNATGRAIRSQLPLKMKMADLYAENFAIDSEPRFRRTTLLIQGMRSAK